MSILRKKQTGATLMIALVMLLVITLIAVGTMRSTTLEMRLTGYRAENARLQNMVDAALREGEFRFYGPGYLDAKLNPKPDENCDPDINKLNIFGNNKPCLLEEMSDEDFKKFYAAPVETANTLGLEWMEYRGLDARNQFEPAVAGSGSDEKALEKPASFNAYRIIEGAAENAAVNPEYGAALRGSGTYYYVVTAKAGDEGEEIAAQSTIATIYLGLD